MRVAPAAQSVSISLSTRGNGAFAPSPVSNPGASSSVQANFCSWVGLVTVVAMAASTVSAVSSGASAVMRLMSTWRGLGCPDRDTASSATDPAGRGRRRAVPARSWRTAAAG
jgi:hypothetical protein